jgi:hypothetical protein
MWEAMQLQVPQLSLDEKSKKTETYEKRLLQQMVTSLLVSCRF